jgi:hypothetical protein
MVSRRLYRRRRRRLLKKLLGNQRWRLENFNFFLSVDGGGWKLFVLGVSGGNFLQIV